MTLDEFYKISTVLTGYTESELIGRGVGESYYDVLTSIIPLPICEALAVTFNAISVDCQTQQDTLIRQDIMANEGLGPVARNILKMWYLSIWYPMPQAWCCRYAEPSQTTEKYQDVEFIISADAYIEGLAWDAIHSHPMGAKQPGFATWSFKPEAIGSASK